MSGYGHAERLPPPPLPSPPEEPRHKPAIDAPVPDAPAIPTNDELDKRRAHLVRMSFAASHSLGNEGRQGLYVHDETRRLQHEATLASVPPLPSGAPEPCPAMWSGRSRERCELAAGHDGPHSCSTNTWANGWPFTVTPVVPSGAAPGEEEIRELVTRLTGYDLSRPIESWPNDLVRLLTAFRALREENGTLRQINQDYSGRIGSSEAKRSGQTRTIQRLESEVRALQERAERAEKVVSAATGWVDFIPEAERSTEADKHLAAVVEAYRRV